MPERRIQKPFLQRIVNRTVFKRTIRLSLKFSTFFMRHLQANNCCNRKIGCNPPVRHRIPLEGPARGRLFPERFFLVKSNSAPYRLSSSVGVMSVFTHQPQNILRADLFQVFLQNSHVQQILQLIVRIAERVVASKQQPLGPVLIQKG